MVEVGKYYIYTGKEIDYDFWDKEIMPKVLDGKPRKCTFVRSKTRFMLEGLEEPGSGRTTWDWECYDHFFKEHKMYYQEEMET